jgi:hypothetical protein
MTKVPWAQVVVLMASLAVEAFFDGTHPQVKKPVDYRFVALVCHRRQNFAHGAVENFLWIPYTQDNLCDVFDHLLVTTTLVVIHFLCFALLLCDLQKEKLNEYTK